MRNTYSAGAYRASNFDGLSLQERLRKSRDYEEKLLELAAWYEWSTPRNLEAASALQDAADAVLVYALSYEAADLLLKVWQPFVGLEAEVGNPPPKPPVQDEGDPTLATMRAAIKDLGQRLDAAKTPQDRDRLKRLMGEQVEAYKRAQKAGAK